MERSQQRPTSMMACFPLSNVFSVFAFHLSLLIAITHSNRRRIVPAISTRWYLMLCDGFVIVMARW
jgi:hypothetical protein